MIETLAPKIDVPPQELFIKESPDVKLEIIVVPQVVLGQMIEIAEILFHHLLQ